MCYSRLYRLLLFCHVLDWCGWCCSILTNTCWSIIFCKYCSLAIYTNVLENGRLWLRFNLSFFLGYIELTLLFSALIGIWTSFLDLKLITLQCYFLFLLGSSILLDKLPKGLLLSAVVSCPIWFFKFLNDTTWLWTTAPFFTIYSLIKVSKELSWSLLVFLFP